MTTIQGKKGAWEFEEVAKWILLFLLAFTVISILIIVSGKGTGLIETLQEKLKHAFT